MYEKLFERNQKALLFIKEKEGLTNDEVNSLLPICKTKLYSKTIVGIADLMTEYSEHLINEQKESLLLLDFANHLNEASGFALNSEGFEEYIKEFLNKQ
jgi:hypothetical protein